MSCMTDGMPYPAAAVMSTANPMSVAHREDAFADGKGDRGGRDGEPGAPRSQVLPVEAEFDTAGRPLLRLQRGIKLS
jgi:hypothetical protein